MYKLMSALVCVLLLAGCANSNPAATDTTPNSAAVPTEAPAIAGGIGVVETPAAPTDAPAEIATEAPTTEVAGEEMATAEATTEPAPTQAPAAGAAVEPAEAGQTLKVVRDRGRLICGAHGSFAGFGTLDASGEFIGFDVDFCKAVAAAIFNDASKVQYRPLSAQERFTAVQTREVDMLSRNTTWTLSRDTSSGLDFAPVTFYDGQGMMVRKSENISTLEDMNGASVCVQSGTTTELNLADNFRARSLEFDAVVFEEQSQAVAAYDEGRCDAITSDKSQLASNRLEMQVPGDHVILDVTMSKEPLAPAVLQGDPQWRDIVSWVIYGTFSAEELGITSENVDTFANSEDPNVRRLLGAEGDLGVGLGLDNTFMINVIKAVGNYGEIYNRHLGPGTPFELPRAQNDLWTNGGLIYAPPFR